jgi:hypothetical protein
VWALAACHWVIGRALQDRKALPTASRALRVHDDAAYVQAHPAVRAKYLVPYREAAAFFVVGAAGCLATAVLSCLTYPGSRHNRMRSTVESGGHFSTQASSR